jgi:hypothetical protein
MPSFPGVDFLDFDSLLSDEENLARNTAGQFVDEQVLSIIVRHDRAGRGDPGARTRRFGIAQLRVGAVGAADVSHSGLRFGSAESRKD